MLALLACEKQVDLAPFRQLMLNCGIVCDTNDVILFDELTLRLNRGGVELLVVALGEQPAAIVPLLRQLQERHQLPILVLGPNRDAPIILQALPAGSSEYADLNADHLREKVASALEKLRRTRAAQPARANRGWSIVVTGAVPGSGVTTVATGLAFALGVKHPQQVLLGELNSGVPELALDLDLKLQITIGQLLHDWQRIDAAAMKRAAEELEGGVFVLAAGSDAGPTSVEACARIISLARGVFDLAVYDVGHGLQTPTAQEAVRTADRVVVVVRLDIPGLRLTRLLANRLADLGIGKESLTLVGNRYGQRGQLSWKQAEEALGSAIDIWLPDDPASVNQALNLGQPVAHAARWAKLNRRLGELAQRVNGKHS